MAESPTARSKLTNHRTILFCLSLLLIELALSLTLTSLSLSKFTTWYRNTHALHRTTSLPIHTALFTATCAPPCVSLGMCAAAAYYWRKKREHGQYAATMRRRGRGYWNDPRDEADGEREREARVWNEVGQEEEEGAKKIDTTQASAMVALGRSGSVKTCGNDEVTKRGVGDIWLRGSGSVLRRSEEIEMQTRDTR
ncbi:hypothetical protein BDU57DRAFT_536962 [Ampelomyces quisqualis]|uniref:Uncharacterized protein n=1 Tax=Ampelomyces quisqualis TaxID=50730 RepID=A0A6A5QNL2_AMPQU|nr:hypothetical protein BDU57DRAFT_536962 [Ampelomyces quisqualis]